MSTTEWPTREQVHAALELVLDDEDQLAEGWRAVLVRIRSDLQHLLGVTPCLSLLQDNHDSLAGEVEPGAQLRPPGIHLGVHYAHSAVEKEWRRYVYRYARRAQASLKAIANDVKPDWNAPLPGEHEAPWPGTEQEPTAPDVDLPEALADRNDLPLIRFGLSQLASAEQAADEEWEMGEYEDEETGEIHHSIPEHLIDTSQELLDEAERWDEYLGDYADAVVYTLATALRDRLNQPSRAAI